MRRVCNGVLLVTVITLMLVSGATMDAQRGAEPARGSNGAAPAGNAANGRKLFIGVGCYQCHGYEAQGSTATGPRLGPSPLPYAALSRYVRRPAGQMPPYTQKVVSDANLADIYAFLQSLPPRAADPALLK
jgi:cytochrome c553